MVFVSLFMLYYNIKLHPHKPEELCVNIVAARNAAAAEAAAAPAAELPLRQLPLRMLPPKLSLPGRRLPPKRSPPATLGRRIRHERRAVRRQGPVRPDAGAAAARSAAALPRQPGLAVMLVGDDPAQAVYVRNKEKDCAECGVRLPGPPPARRSHPEQELLALVEELNRPGRTWTASWCSCLCRRGWTAGPCSRPSAPEKDVDAFHPENVGRLLLGLRRYPALHPRGDHWHLLRALRRLPRRDRPLCGGGPQQHRGKAHGPAASGRRTPPSPSATAARRIWRSSAAGRTSSISAVGRRGLITADMVKPGAVVVDVAMNRNEEGKLCGDVDFAAVAEKAAYITPVPGGVGPMTRAMLMENTVSASRRRQRKED